MDQNNLNALLKDLDNLQEPPGGYDKAVDRFSNIAVLDHERKAQYRRVVIALGMSDPITVRLQLQQIEKDFFDGGQAIVNSVAASRDLDGHGKVLQSTAPISDGDQAAFDARCSELRIRVLDALTRSGYVAADPVWLL